MLLRCSAFDRRLLSTAVFWLCFNGALYSSWPFVGAIDDKCEACKIVARELIARVEAEGPRNHLDMRSRLDPSGKRHGKVIEYRLSELRMIELLEDLCDAVRHYTWGYRNPNDGTPLQLGWIHVNVSHQISFAMSKEEKKGRHNELNIYCGRLIEEFEDDLVEAIRKDFDTAEIVEVLCIRLAKACEDGSSRVEL